MDKKWATLFSGKPEKASRKEAGVSSQLPEPIPIPSVTEGNDESDWALWEDSVAFQDSQFPQDLTASSVQIREVRVSSQSAPAGVDPFASVTKNSK